MTIDRLKTVSDIVATWVGLAALLIGGAFGLIQYLEKERADRVKATMELHLRFNSSDIFGLHKRVTSVWNERLDELAAAAARAATKKDEWSNYINGVVVEQQLAPDILGLVDFYETVQICAESKVCDRPTADAFFGTDARRFYLLHVPYIEQLRSKRRDSSYGRILEAFARGQKVSN